MFEPFDYFAKDRIFSVQGWIRRYGDKELSATSIGLTCVRHRHNAGAVVAMFWTDFIANRKSRTFESCSRGISALNHEIRNDAVERKIVVVRPPHRPARARIGPLFFALGETNEVLNSHRRVFVEQADHK